MNMDSDLVCRDHFDIYFAKTEISSNERNDSVIDPCKNHVL